MAFIKQEPRYSLTDGDRGFVFSTIPALPRGNAPGMGRDMGRDRAVVPENKTVRVVKGNEADSVTSNRSNFPLPGSHDLPGNRRQAHSDRACCHNVDVSKRGNRMRRVYFGSSLSAYLFSNLFLVNGNFWRKGGNG
jgi:hypothetical protein